MALPYPKLQRFGVQLLALQTQHAQGLLAAASDGDLSAITYTTVPGPSLESVEKYIQEAITAHQAGTMQAFVVCDDAGEILGSTRYYDIEMSTPTLAIGYTFYAARAQRTHVNTACKLLLLQNAFETIGARSVYFHTSHLNLRSQAAIGRIGGHLDGILRQHRMHKDGTPRDTYTYSIIDSEWPIVKSKLLARLQFE
jgi:RimJ/RimL family protein N-acetyltransferase